VPVLGTAPERRLGRLVRRLSAYGVAVGAVTAGLAAFLLVQLTAWPPHEDETLVFFLSRQPVGELLDAVSERGGAPLHFLLAHVVLLISPTLEALRLLSLIPVVAALPVIAALAARLAGRSAAIVATVVVAVSWTTLYHGIYARMYGLFLLATALSFLLLLRARERPTAVRWTLWALAALAAVALQPYGALVFAIQALYVLSTARRSLRSLAQPALAFGLVLAAAVPLWITYAHLASRFGVEAGTGGEAELGRPGEVAAYLWETLGAFTAGWPAAQIPIALTALTGLVLLTRRNRDAAVLMGLVVLVPAAVLFLTRSGTGLFLEPRHLLFALPFLAIALAVAILAAARAAGRYAPAVVAVAVACLVALEVAWGVSKTPWLYKGEPNARETARAEAAAWLAETGRVDDVLFGYEPTYLDARLAGAPFGELFVPRADPVLALQKLREAGRPLGRGIWVLDASDQLSPSKVELRIQERSPGPGFEARAFGPFLIVRTRAPTGTPERFLEDTAQVERLGRALSIFDAGLNLRTAEAALRLERQP
jgi:4-amino-4-deoxy-L-arabinose transferase-like glycosyltransferase